MSVTLKPYPEYKDSGVPWLGKVPAHWEVLPNRALFAEVKERNHPDEQMLSVTITKGVIRQQALLAGSSKKDSSNEDKSAYKLVCPREIAYNKMRAWQGAVGVSEYRGIVSPAYVVVRLRNDQNPWYFHHLYRTPMFAKEAERWSYGITSDMWSLRPEHFKMIYTALPPLPEQSPIVRFIAHFDRRINRLIRAKRRLIELLNEQKQAIIHRAVTRGLDPNVRLKPSGSDWLGDVPEHCQVVPLRWHLSIGSGEFLSADQFSSERAPERPYPVIGGNGVMGYADRFNTQGVTIVIGRVGALCGNIHLVTEPSWITDNALRVTNVKGFDLEYLALQLQAMNLNRLANANAQPLVTGSIIKSQRVIKPTTQEQRRIVQQLREAVGPLESAIDRAHREIDLLFEYRTRLIADVVMGKLDVRGVELPSLDEGEAVEDLKIGEDTETDEMTDIEEITNGDEQ